MTIRYRKTLDKQDFTILKCKKYLENVAIEKTNDCCLRNRRMRRWPHKEDYYEKIQ